MDLERNAFTPMPQTPGPTTRSEAAHVPTPRPLLTSSLLLLSDLVAVALAALLGNLAWSQVNSLVDPAAFLQLWPILFAFPLSYFVLGLYPGAGINPVEELKRLFYATSGIFAMAVIVLFLSDTSLIESRGVYLSSWLLALVLVPLGRSALRHLVAHRTWWGVPVVILGAGKTGLLLIERLASNPGLGLKVLACFDDDPAKHGNFRGVTVSGPLSRAEAFGKRHRTRHALIAMPGLVPEQLTRLTRRYAGVFPSLIVVPDMFGMASLGLSTMDFAGIVGLHAKQNLLLRHNRFAKRCIDLALLLPATLVAAPLLVLAVLWIITVSRGSPFYAQEREGYGGKPIRVWKLRTMYSNADVLLERHLKDNPAARQEWERFFKLRNDPRIFPGAGALRKLSLDELPQLLNILKGEMSFVGPRPFPYYHLESFNEEFRSLRTEAKPGVTGLWQVSARSEGDLSIQEALDSYYIRNWSPWLDLYILARTPWAVLFGKGAY